jgi:hypothetical protein
LTRLEAGRRGEVIAKVTFETSSNRRGLRARVGYRRSNPPWTSV